MTDPTLALSLFGVATASLAMLFWPQRGLYWRWQRVHWKNQSVHVEDALKHIYDCEYLSRAATVDSLAGYLGISSNRVVDLIQRLHDLGMLTTEAEALCLTPNGRSSALRVIRIHRLWERYLADQTGLHETQWQDCILAWSYS